MPINQVSLLKWSIISKLSVCVQDVINKLSVGVQDVISKLNVGVQGVIRKLNVGVQHATCAWNPVLLRYSHSFFNYFFFNDIYDMIYLV